MNFCYDLVIDNVMTMMTMMMTMMMKTLTLVVKSASSCLSVRDLLGNSRQKSWMIIIVIVVIILVVIFIIVIHTWINRKVTRNPV